MEILVSQSGNLSASAAISSCKSESVPKLDRPAILKELASATNDIARGEIIQLNLFENYLHLDLDDLLKVSYLKTGRLFEAAAKTGAMLAGSSEADVKSFGLLGKNLGIAFQIQDDILDYESLHINTGKPALQDFQEGKITFPLFYTLNNSAKDDQKFLLGMSHSMLRHHYISWPIIYNYAA